MSFNTPDLPYSYDALEPYIDKTTMQIHHDKHHTGYTSKLNAAVEGTEFSSWSIEELLKDLGQLPSDLKTAVQNNGGGHFNHSLFWKVMGPGAGGHPEGAAGDAIDRDFGSFNDFVSAFSSSCSDKIRQRMGLAGFRSRR